MKIKLSVKRNINHGLNLAKHLEEGRDRVMGSGSYSKYNNLCGTMLLLRGRYCSPLSRAGSRYFEALGENENEVLIFYKLNLY